MQTILLAFVISLSPLPTSSPPWICLVPEVPQAFDRAKAVFVGQVVEIVEPTTWDENAPLRDRFFIVRFKVERSWKGADFASEIDVLSDQGRGCFADRVKAIDEVFHSWPGCRLGPTVKKGEKYLVYADPAFENGGELEGFIIMDSCSRTARLPVSTPRATLRFTQSELDPEDGSADLRKLDAIMTMPSKPRRVNPFPSFAGSRSDRNQLDQH